MSRKCTMCGANKRETDFYVSYSILNKATKRMSICKDCALSIFNANLEKYNDAKIALYNTCQMLDVYYSNSLYEAALQQSLDNNNNIFAIYMQKVNSLIQYKDKTFADSDIFNVKNDNLDTQSYELIEKWGEGYTQDQYRKLEKFYQDMYNSFHIDTPTHRQLLKFICILNLKMEECLQNGDTAGFAKLSQQYETMMRSAKFRPIDRVSADVASGMRTFSQIFEEVEKRGFVEPDKIQVEQDIVDKEIMYKLNYIRKLLNLQKLTTPPPDTPKVDGSNEVVDDVQVNITKDTEIESDEDGLV